MNASIVTIYDSNPNYGNRLQNYATHTILSQLGFSVETISYGSKIHKSKLLLKRLIHAALGYRLTSHKNYWKYHVPKILAFEEFNRRYIPSYHVNDVSDIKASDFFFLGSDQVWNVTWFSDDDIRKDLFFLTFCKPEQKICLSPSFGFDRIPENWVDFFQEYLSSMSRLSVREISGAALVKELTGRDVPVLIDPSLMLDADQWLHIAKPPRSISCDNPYILTYFLGECSEQRHDEIQHIAHQIGAKVFNLQDLSQPDLYWCDPGEFLFLVKNAALVLTDSFHASVFSFLFEKPFLVYDREGAETGMISRISTLLEKFHLERKYKNSGMVNELLECDYRAGFAVLQRERQIFYSFLQDAVMLKNVE